MANPIQVDLSTLTPQEKHILRTLYSETFTTWPQNNTYIAPNEQDPIYITIIGIRAKSNLKSAQNASTTTSKPYNGPSDVDEYINFRITEYPQNWDHLLKVGQYLLLHNVIPTDDLINWAQYFSNLMIDTITPATANEPEAIVFLNNLPLFPAGKVLREFAAPPNPHGFTPQFDPSASAYAHQLTDIATLTEEKARYYFPIIFLFILRSRLGIHGSNYRNRLDRITDFNSIYNIGSCKVQFPENHHARTLMTMNTTPSPATNPIDRDILAKFIKLRTGIRTSNIGRISYGIIIQNTVFFGLSHYVAYERLVAKLGEPEAPNIIGSITTRKHAAQTKKFYELVAVGERFPDDDMWYCVRAIDSSFMYDLSPRSLNWIMMNLAYYVQYMNLDANNTPYTNMMSMQSDVYKPLDSSREAHLDNWIAYWKANIQTENVGSLNPPQLASQGVPLNMEMDAAVIADISRAFS